ncbi:1-aminocyclopropane-1-carboxylate deaminase/D-cysteine desulfhydrase, partial [Frankia sp. AgKG'84/4]|uniref:1-aminocyclopropane-1-carboxylate deaminase/D-cysteine desulfhydrase n=1 Tax=Frankia sp. AgKG'84/4 TaxID=573490 RepID=UPI0035B3B446|nr:1-aminocyclopropane-1-carboxylate deaminase/D-cysteine desulfhydrase [Frankia sp. AgKG'84/4]
MNDRPLPAGRRDADPSLAAVAGARLPSPLVETVDDRLDARGVRLLLKRDDLIHPDIPGNKWRKLGPNLARAQALGYRGVLTFGGAYSNHLRAVAAAGRLLGLRTIGVIRGEEHRPLNPVLRFAADAGMHLTYLDRASYRAVRAGTGAAVLARLDAEFGPAYLLPEGASNALGVRGCAELPAEINQDFDLLC